MAHFQPLISSPAQHNLASIIILFSKRPWTVLLESCVLAKLIYGGKVMSGRMPLIVLGEFGPHNFLKNLKVIHTNHLKTYLPSGKFLLEIEKNNIKKTDLLTYQPNSYLLIKYDTLQ